MFCVLFDKVVVISMVISKLLLDKIFLLSRIMKVEVWVIRWLSQRPRLLTLLRPWLFWISRKPHPIICLLAWYYNYFVKECAEHFSHHALLPPKTSSNNIVLLYIEWKKWKSCFCLFTEGKQHKACGLDIRTLRNHTLQSCMTWYPVTLSVLTWLLYNLQLEDVSRADFKNSPFAFSQSERK